MLKRVSQMSDNFRNGPSKKIFPPRRVRYVEVVKPITKEDYEILRENGYFRRRTLGLSEPTTSQLKDIYDSYL